MDPKSIFTARLLGSLVNEIVIDTALHAHSSAKKARRVCPQCGERYVAWLTQMQQAEYVFLLT